MTDIKTLYQLYMQRQTLTTDSRDCPEGSMFLALKGDKFDGNQYALAALEKGCAYAVVSDPQVLEQASGELRPRVILVEDTLLTLKRLAREHRRQFHIPVLAITGTNGKTTTKELIAAVLSRRYNVLYTEGNLNNDIGVPKTLLRLRPEHDVAIVEMGASHPGDIKTLAETAEPTCGLITNVGRAHLQGFGSFEGVCRTKGELYDWLASGGADAVAADVAAKGDMPLPLPRVFLNAADPTLCRMADERGLRRRATYAPQEGSRSNPFLCVPFGGGELQTQLIGLYNEPNVMAAIAVGRAFGVDDALTAQALAGYRPTNNRSQLERTARNTLIIDAYNANPSSMSLAIDNFANMESEGDKVAILGQMNELGAESRQEHLSILRQLERAALRRVVLVGPEFCALQGETAANFTFCPTTDDVKRLLQQRPPQGCTILIKGSNSFRLYELPTLL